MEDAQQHAESYCQRQIEMPPLQKVAIFFSGVPDSCDLCGFPLLENIFFADCQMPHSERWGYLCASCIAAAHIRFGWGKGQLYQRQADQQWLLVAGFPEG